MSLLHDGLTPETLRTSHKSWWHDAFTRLLLEAVPPHTRQLVELDCGLAGAAHALLPMLPEARYLGCDLDPERVNGARRELAAASLEARAEVRLAAATALPLGDGEADLVLSVMALQQQPQLGAALAEAARVLRAGGKLVAIEPDSLGQRLYFDGGLEEVSQAFHALALRARVARQPADLALGPRLPACLVEAGLHRVRMTTHAISSTALEAASAFFGRLQRAAEQLALESGLAADDPLVLACGAAIRRCLYSGLPKRVGYSCHLVPVFLCVGVR